MEKAARPACYFTAGAAGGSLRLHVAPASPDQLVWSTVASP